MSVEKLIAVVEEKLPETVLDPGEAVTVLKHKLSV